MAATLKQKKAAAAKLHYINSMGGDAVAPTQKTAFKTIAGVAIKNIAGDSIHKR